MQLIITLQRHVVHNYHQLSLFTPFDCYSNSVFQYFLCINKVVYCPCWSWELYSKPNHFLANKRPLNQTPFALVVLYVSSFLARLFKFWDVLGTGCVWFCQVIGWECWCFAPVKTLAGKITYNVWFTMAADVSCAGAVSLFVRDGRRVHGFVWNVRQLQVITWTEMSYLRLSFFFAFCGRRLVVMYCLRPSQHWPVHHIWRHDDDTPSAVEISYFSAVYITR